MTNTCKKWIQSCKHLKRSCVLKTSLSLSRLALPHPLLLQVSNLYSACKFSRIFQLAYFHLVIDYTCSVIVSVFSRRKVDDSKSQTPPAAQAAIPFASRIQVRFDYLAISFDYLATYNASCNNKLTIIFGLAIRFCLLF